MAKAAVAAPVPRPTALVRRLITPEGVDLSLTLASGGERLSAFLLDGAIILGALTVLSIAALAALLAVKANSGGAAAIIWLAGGFVLRNGYFALFELGARAATPGKRALGLRVIARDGGPLTAEAILTRNALREIEFFLPLTLFGATLAVGDPVDKTAALLGLAWTGLFLIFPLLNRDRLRVGDFLAGTLVIHAPRMALLPDLAAEAMTGREGLDFTAAQTEAYGVKELDILDAVLRRRDPKAMAAVAARIRAKIDYPQPSGETDAAFLTAYYAALRARLEQRLLFGHRRKDKFDTA